MHRTVIVSDISYECDTGCPILMEQCKLRVFDTRVIRAILGLSGTTRMRKGKNYRTSSFVIPAPCPIYSDKIRGNGIGRALDL